MDGQRKAGNELLAISHNANLSDGIMFPLEVDSKNRPIDAAWAQDRVNNEPLTEIHQLKGTSETTPLLSPNDEFADYELLSYFFGGGERDSQNPRQLCPRGLAERTGECKTAAATTPTRWESWAPATRITRLPATARATILAATDCWMPRPSNA